MNPVRKQRLIVVLAVFLGLALATALAVYALRQNINLFFTPQQVVSGEAPVGTKMRVGGLVMEGSVVRDPDTLDVTFDVTDGKGTFTVHYQGILPDLFREGQGIVANGTLVSRERFEAEEVLAKHDETYMPPEVQDALEKAGHPGARKDAAGS
ncbi:cytochrome c maturation protein CcmE [Alloalcanivorax xenomutans]|jgi:cytochrome c-type biogenesis protein CcmE|uniref:Cytochrome c-type biogenesis protein CcmE n=1 Tax=Alloalcanivorax balearicus MACL04 TaxID=1177182 RepID=A0ABT2R2R8_9GAMM|nr:MULTISPECIES: cytochrome c maturation protein CcmE [Alloalcanivorax]KYZ87088.1 cytochrome c biogenesis protein CcmE [Alcanivorax sp. KX64203]MBA4723361.1 cytochrome c maturation protein CcmE [Alcanivorax sp.]MCU5784071.1 cytochrome c-type biogenesis protein CcmE [Alloalcanivorax balearicus MACL04]WOA32936.1 cytochrome c maturation protein CcmE [Alloalcanivorax xenomutans]WOD29889.1 cytochrome c maturation protein CcmE [Alloalcanivorax xenomutans]